MYLKLFAVLCVLCLLAGCAAQAAQPDTAAATTTPDIETVPATASVKDEDQDAAWDPATATAITLSGTTAAVSGSGATVSGAVVTITAAGTYAVTGSLEGGQLIVQAPETALVRIVLQDAALQSVDGPAIWVQQADKVVLILEGESTVTDGAVYTLAAGDDEPNAAVFSKEDLSITGEGALTVTGSYENGILSKDDLVITGGALTVTAVKDCLRGRDSVRITDGTFDLTAGGDGIQSNNDTDADKGYVTLDGGDYRITAGNDAIQAETVLTVNGGAYDLTTGGGAASVTHTAQSGGFGERPMGGGARPEGFARPEDASTTAAAEPVASTAEATTDSYKALKAGTALTVTAGSFTIDAQDDAVHCNGDVSITGGDFSIQTGDDGFHADNLLAMGGGIITIDTCYEGLEGASVQISGGEIRLTAYDDGVNAAGGSDGETSPDTFATRESCDITISGGTLWVDASGDGLDANGSLYLSGGVTLVNGPESGGNGTLDYDGQCIVTGGVLLAAGSSAMAQTPGADSTQPVLSVTYTQAQSAGTAAVLTDQDGNVLVAFAPSKQYENLVISLPALSQGQAYTLLSGGVMDGEYQEGGVVSGAQEVISVTLDEAVTAIRDDGTAYTAGGAGGMGGGKPGGKTRPTAAP